MELSAEAWEAWRGWGAVRPTAAWQGLPVGALTTSCHPGGSLREHHPPHLPFISDLQRPRDKVLFPSPTSMLGKFPVGSSGHSNLGRLEDRGVTAWEEANELSCADHKPTTGY